MIVYGRVRILRTDLDVQKFAALLVRQPACQAPLGERDQILDIQRKGAHCSIRSRRRQAPAIRAEGDAKHIAGIAEEAEHLFTGGDIPDLSQPVKAGGG